MILKKEIFEKSKEWKVPPETIDKDWVLGHFLSGFYSINEHKDKLFFKGGTALRKCYFPNYRFSEDLDFTSVSNDYKLTRKKLNDVIKIVERNSGILFDIQEIKELNFRDKLVGYQAKIKYWGANHPKNQIPPSPERWMTNIKVEITLFEKIIFEPENKLINHPYSDSLIKVNQKIPCYSLNEIIVEKIRALVQRSYSAPRDFYDIYFLINNIKEEEWGNIRRALVDKMKFKGFEYVNFKKLLSTNKVNIIKSAWKSSLEHQIQKEKLPSVELVIDELEKLFEKYF